VRPGAASAQAAAEEPAQVLVPGTCHFANPGLDVVQTEVPDVLTSAKQDEIVRERPGQVRPRPVLAEATEDHRVRSI
jgi:hypothetical protein